VTPFDSLVGFRRTSGGGWDYRADPTARIAYARVESIRSSTLHELRQLERQLQADGMRALVLDFRDSAGEGMLQHAALVADGLLDGGLMWTVRGTGGPAKEYRADRECLFRGWPLAVLVNGIADNAQGAVLAALQDNRWAALVGEPTRSDGFVRQLFRLPDQSGITVVIGRLERADKSRGWPVVPDVTVGLTAEQLAAVRQWFATKDLPEPPPGGDNPPDDSQLARALALLRDALKAGPSPAKGAAAGGK
jgi:C-terminal processing protease CtpA/Prc